jgi:8-oxo-dGTP pyrophosphatase MutT (NUDIX family)
MTIMTKKGQYTYEYPHPAVTADCVVFGYDGKELKVLLIKRGKEKEASTTAYVGEWALPGGFLDAEADKNVAFTASRELKEETGAAAGDFTYLGPFYPTCAYSDEVIHMYLATGLSFGKPSPDDDEFIAPVRIPLRTLIDDVMAGKIADGKTQTALLKAWMALQS